MEKLVKQVTECSSSNSGLSTCNEFDRKLHLAAAGQTPFFYKLLLERISRKNANVIVDFIISLKREANVSLGYVRLNILTLADLERHSQYRKFSDMTTEDILRYFDSIRKSDDVDPMHKWIGTHTLRRGILIKFFRWLYYGSVEAKKRPKPKVVQNIPKYKRKEQSIYKPTDLWTHEDDLLFLKYCPSKRDRCYHTISRDLSCRPSEILNLRIKDIIFKSVENFQYAEVLVNGKTGTRHIPLINSIPYLKDWLDSHPQRGNSNAFLIPNLSDCGLGKKLSSSGVLMTYRKYRSKFFPSITQNDDLLKDEKQKIESLLKKPWNPYIRRHSALTEKSTILKEHVLRQHAGWTPGSQMHLKYLHYFGNESSDSILEAYGIVSKDQKLADTHRPKQCPNCNEPNKPDSKFCAKCRLVLSYDAYNETLEEQKKKEDKVALMEDKFTTIQSQIQALLSVICGINNDKQKQDIANKLIEQGIYKPAH